MKGFEVLWAPGTDHAGISTQIVVEKWLYKKHKKRRRDFSREEFLGHINAWVKEHQHIILSQIEKLGCSCDFTKLRFTMDTQSNKAVNQVFKDLFDKGLIYQGDYLVNWDPITQTALSDDEVEYEEREGSLWYFSYGIADSTETITIATTRPETMLGDVAIAVHPSDERYAHLIGKKAILPIKNRPISIIADHYVDPSFGTGAVKITPAHDPNDYEIGNRHNLERINIMNDDGTINSEGGEFEGLTMHDGRKAIVKAMDECGALLKEEPHTHRISLSYRSKAIIEPYLSKQWFLKMEPFKKRLIEVVENQEVSIIPKEWEKTYFHWIRNLKDWCISRQLWWGHRIPIWKNINDPTKVICHNGADPPESIDLNEWRQEEDVLDTWFSSALWPFSVWGWPDNSPLFDKFYPTSTLITAHDILFFWVARMILMSEVMHQKVPFEKAFIHGLIFGKSYWKEKDGHIEYLSPSESECYEKGAKLGPGIHSKWEKMSKSKGNVIDPLHMIDQYGTDAVRFSLSSIATQAKQIDLDSRKFEDSKNFANKIWNATRFIFLTLTEKSTISDADFDQEVTLIEDRWILHLLSSSINSLEKHIENFEFDKASSLLYSLFWDQFCSYTVETAKPYLFGNIDAPALVSQKKKLLFFVLLTLLKMLHPFIPFITEKLFQILKTTFPLSIKATDIISNEVQKTLNAPALCVAPFPSFDYTDAKGHEEFIKLQDIIRVIRNIRTEMQLPMQMKSTLYLLNAKKASNVENIILSLVPISTIYWINNEDDLPDGPKSMSISHGVHIYIPLPKEHKESEALRLKRELEKLHKEKLSVELTLSNPAFIERAPTTVVDKQRKHLKELEAKYSKLQVSLNALL